MRSGGWTAVRSDFRHYCRVHGAHTPARKLLLPVAASSLLALAVYRYGAWIYFGGSRALPHRLAYLVLSETVRRLTKVLIPVWAEIDDQVWLASHAPLVIGGNVSRGVAIHAGATIGLRVGGPSQAIRGVPQIGAGAIIGPGASITGPIRIPDGAVIGPNTVVTRSLPDGAWLGIPPSRWAGPPHALFPASFPGELP